MLSSKLHQLDITLPPLAGPFGSYVPAKRVGDLVYVSGQLPMNAGKLLASGPVPTTCSIDDARAAARQCVINALAAASTVVSLDDLIGVVRVGAFVNSANDFTQQPLIANAASDFLIELFGDAGKHVRAAVGVNTLPLGASVEIEVVFVGR